jgi:hypothetical protein
MLHRVYRGLKEGLRIARHNKVVKEYGRQAAFKMQIKLLRGLTKQFGRITFDKRILKRALFAVNYEGAGRHEIEISKAKVITFGFTSHIIQKI